VNLHFRFPTCLRSIHTHIFYSTDIKYISRKFTDRLYVEEMKYFFREEENVFSYATQMAAGLQKVNCEWWKLEECGGRRSHSMSWKNRTQQSRDSFPNNTQKLLEKEEEF